MRTCINKSLILKKADQGWNKKIKTLLDARKDTYIIAKEGTDSKDIYKETFCTLPKPPVAVGYRLLTIRHPFLPCCCVHNSNRHRNVRQMYARRLPVFKNGVHHPQHNEWRQYEHQCYYLCGNANKWS